MVQWRDHQGKDTAQIYVMTFLLLRKYFLQTHEQLWLEIAEKVTMCVQQIIEFAKMVPGFMSLLQDDQIMLLKGTIVTRETFEDKIISAYDKELK